MDLNKKTVGLELAATMRTIGKRIHTAFYEAGENVTIEQFIILNLLSKSDNLTQQDLSVMLNKDKSAILRHIDELEKKRLVVRIPDTEDRRKKILMLTKKGVEALGRLNELETAIFEQALKNISNEHLKVLSLVLNQIKSNSQ